MVLGEYTHMSETSENYTGLRPVYSVTKNQEPLRLAFTCTYLVGPQPAVFPPFFAPSFLIRRVYGQFSIETIHERRKRNRV